MVSGIAASTVFYFVGVPFDVISNVEEITSERENEMEQEQTIPGGIQQTTTESQNVIPVTDVTDIV